MGTVAMGNRSMLGPVGAPSLCGKAVLHHYAVEMVGFVLQASSEVASTLNRDPLPELVLPVADREVRTGELCVGAWERQASFVLGH